MYRNLAAAVAAALLIVTGLVHGRWTDRWSPAADPAAAAARLPDVPMRLGDWEGRDVEDKTRREAGLAGTLRRRYTNRLSGESVEFYLECGRPVAVGIHNPEACYGASGFRMGQRQAVPAAPAAGEFWTADATRTGTGGDETRLRLFWAWSGGSSWAAVEDARWTFPQVLPVLYKLYVVRDLAGEETKGVEPCRRFMELLLPELGRKVFNPGS